MRAAERRDIVKTSLGLSGSFHDDIIQNYIVEVETFLLSAGVPASVVFAAKTTGTIARGVSDLWNYGNDGEAKLSPYFMQRVAQLKLERGGRE